MAGTGTARGNGRRARAVLAAAIASLAMLVPAGSSHAATEFGNNLSGGATSILVCAGPCSLWNEALPTGSVAGTLTAPSNGVVTSFSLVGASATPGNPWAPVHLRVIRSDGGNQWSGLGASVPDVTPSNAGGLQTFPARVPIAAGDYIGLESFGGSIRAGVATPGATLAIAGAFPRFGDIPPNDNIPDLGLALRATLEPDADCDGFGDETQDPSPGGSKGACACPPQRATIVGTVEDDLLVGTKKRDVILALSGDDRIKGAGGPDLICGNDGADRIAGGPGADRLVGGPHSDRLHGGRGRDRCRGGRRALCER